MSTTVTSDDCRIAVQTETSRLDLVVPANIAVAQIIPSIVDLASADASGSWQPAPADWQLSPLGAPPLASQLSLRDNDVCDGDLLLLTRVHHTVSSPPTDGITAISTSLDRIPQWTPAGVRVAALIVAACCSGIVAYALVRSDSHAAALIAGGLSAVAAAGAVVHGRAYSDGLAVVTLGGSATAFGAVAGYLVVPGQAMAPKLMLAAVIGATVAVVIARCTACGTAFFAAAAAAGILSAADSCVFQFIATPTGAAGAALASAAAAILAVASRLAMWIGRLRAPRLRASPELPDDATDGDLAANTRRAHAIMTGLMCGMSAAAALGATLTTLGDGFQGALFASVIGLALVLQAGTHVDLVQAAALIFGGAAALTAVSLWAISTQPHAAHWIGLGAAVAGAATIGLTRTSLPASPLRRRCVELIEYTTFAAVMPLACWVCGVFSAMRGLG